GGGAGGGCCWERAAADRAVTLRLTAHLPEGCYRSSPGDLPLGRPLPQVRQPGSGPCLRSGRPATRSPLEAWCLMSLDLLPVAVRTTPVMEPAVRRTMLDVTVARLDLPRRLP